MFNIVTRGFPFFFLACFLLLFYLQSKQLYIYRDLQKSYLDILTWLVRMESTVTTDDTNENTLINDVLKKTSLLNSVWNLK